MKYTTIMYRYYDQNGNCLYIGISYDFMRRCKQHAHRKWFHKICYAKIDHFEHRSDAVKAEQIAIATEEPIFNITGNVIHKFEGSKSSKDDARFKNMLLHKTVAAVKAGTATPLSAACEPIKNYSKTPFAFLKPQIIEEPKLTRWEKIALRLRENRFE